MMQTAKSVFEAAKTVMEVMSASSQVFQILQEDPALRAARYKLKITLLTSRNLIERSECWRFKCKVDARFQLIDELIPQIKDATYEARNLLDEFTCQELKLRVEGAEGSSVSGRFSASLTNIGNWCKDCTTNVNNLIEWLVFLNKTLEEDCNRLGLPQTPNKFTMEARPVTSSTVIEPKVYGRDKDLDKVVRLLGVPFETNDNGSPSRKRVRISECIDMPESSSTKEKDNTYVLPIVGIGGVGKTTLAQMMCNTEKVKSHFDPIMWVCVSDRFNVVRLTKEIIECATGKSPDINNLNLLQKELTKTLESKRFLLVLDDVWSESKADWLHLFGPLKEGSPGSMIIVTTRSSQVAEIMATVKKDIISLDGLDGIYFREFFKSCVFGPETNTDKYSDLMKIGEKIIVKLKGSPLAAKTLGAVLSRELSVRHWEYIRDSEIWKLHQEEDGIMPVLQLSYQYLPSYLKKCFSFCSLFPKDYGFSENKLIRFWISEGFIDSQEIRKMENVARDYLRELVNICFFQKTIQDTYVIHDLMHDVSQLITKDECFLIERGNCEKKIPTDIRHLSVFSEELEMDKLKVVLECKKLCTLKIQAYRWEFNAINKLFNELTNIGSLSLAGCQNINLPDNIVNLKYLRYLDISGMLIKQLPNSFCNLYKLEILDMSHCRHFQCFPDDSNRLISMKLLILPIDKIVSLVGHVPNLANVIQTQNLILEITKEKDNTIGGLKLINGIYNQLTIKGLGNVSNKEAERAQLNKKEFLKTLCLSWDTTNNYEEVSIASSTNNDDEVSISSSTNNDDDASIASLTKNDDEVSISSSTDNDDEVVLECLCPHPNLQNLRIELYGGEILNPSWLKTETLTNLTTITIRVCSNITTIPCLPRSITELEVEGCSMLTSLQDCLVPNSLPSLEKIKISYCYELVSMSLEAFHEFKHLQHLSIWGCPKLTCERDMVLPPSLLTLRLFSCGEVEDRFSSSLPNLTSLTNLFIGFCQRLTSVPLHNLKSDYLTVWDCSQLQSIGGRELLASVKNIDICSCPKLEETNGKDYKKC